MRQSTNYIHRLLLRLLDVTGLTKVAFSTIAFDKIDRLRRDYDEVELRNNELMQENKELHQKLVALNLYKNPIGDKPYQLHEDWVISCNENLDILRDQKEQQFIRGLMMAITRKAHDQVIWLTGEQYGKLTTIVNRIYDEEK